MVENTFANDVCFFLNFTAKHEKDLFPPNEEWENDGNLQCYPRYHFLKFIVLTFLFTKYGF